MESANKVPFCLSGYDALDNSVGCPCSRSDRFAITSHSSRNLVKLIYYSANSCNVVLMRQCRLVAGSIGLATCHDCPDSPCCFVCHAESCNPHGLSREQIGQPWLDRLGIVLCTAHK